MSRLCRRRKSFLFSPPARRAKNLAGKQRPREPRRILLLGKQLYRKVFKKGGDEPRKTDSIFNRLDVDFGNVDPRTGEQNSDRDVQGERSRCADRGDLGVAGGFSRTGQISHPVSLTGREERNQLDGAAVPPEKRLPPSSFSASSFCLTSHLVLRSGRGQTPGGGAEAEREEARRQRAGEDRPAGESRNPGQHRLRRQDVALAAQRADDLHRAERSDDCASR